MYALHKELHPPTGMEHSLYCHFFNSDEKNLVIAGVNQLQVYRLKTETEVPGKTTDKGPDVKLKEKLENMCSFSLFGRIMSMQSVRLASSSRDALLLSFQDAKLSLVEFDPSTYDLKTLSLHCFEEEELKDGHCQQKFHIPIVRVDPDGRCAAMLIYGTRLVILPFRRESATDDPDLVGGSSRPPILSSYVIDLRNLDEKIINVIDIQFLHGYYEPTIFILYEPLPTWAGRVAVRKDSCSIVAISLNLQQRVHPTIWSLGNLPYDCKQTFPVEKPIGGVLLFAVNSLLYLNQSFPPYGVSLNSMTNFSSDFLLKPDERVKISLDCAQATFISHEKLVISLKGGELYVLTLIADSMRAVRSLNLEKAAASVLTTCMCQCGDGHIFLGSRLGNSLLLRYTEKPPEGIGIKADAANKKEKTDEPASKKKKTDAIGDWIASDVKQIDDLDELEVYGVVEAQYTGSEITMYSFEVCDSIMNIGPCSHMVMGEPAFLSEEFSNSIDPDIELVTTSGFSKNGAISVLQRSIRPQVVTTFELPGCLDMWTVCGPQVKDPEDADEAKEDDEEKKETVEGGHSLLILSRDDSTMVLKTGQEIMELDHSGFATQGPTVYAGNICNDKYIIQVTAAGVGLLEGVEQLQHIPVDAGSPVVSCHVADPYVLLLSEEGNVVLLVLRTTAGEEGVRLVPLKPTLHQNSKILTVCTYKDISGVFTTKANKSEKTTEQPSQPQPPVAEKSFCSETSLIDDEDELLYGETTDKTPSKHEETVTEKDKSSSSAHTSASSVKPTYWAVLSRENGVLEIYDLPDFKLAFLVRNFPMGQKVLMDSIQMTDPGSKTGVEKPVGVSELPVVKELLITGLGTGCSRPHLLARVDDDLVIYEAFTFSSGVDKHLQIRFRRHTHGLILRQRKLGKMSKKEQQEAEAAASKRVCHLRPFTDISGYSGVFICGHYPHWLFMSYRGCLRIHPMGIDGNITCFAPFHNVNCPRGFLYFNKTGELRISVLPTHLSYDACWPVRKVPLRCTPHFVIYHSESKTYSVVTSTYSPTKQVVRLCGEGDKEIEVVERDDRFIHSMLEKFNIQLFSPVSWEPIPNTRIDLDEYEHVTCIRNVTLKSRGTMSGLKDYIAVSTNYSFNEDVSTKGRVIIYDVVDVVPEPGQPLTKNRMKVEYDKEQKGPVSALDAVSGFLITAIGQKIYIWQLTDQDLVGVAFIDTQVYIHSIITIKNMILIADIFKSVTLLRYQDDMKVLSLVSRDMKLLEVYGISFLVDSTNLCFLVCDKNQNFLVYSYQPEVRESLGGQRLLLRADFCLGSHVNTLFRIRSRLSDPSTDAICQGPLERKHVTYYASLDGSIGYLLPIAEKIYRRLLMLQNCLTVHLQHLAGLNPKSFRHIKQEQHSLMNPQKNILDGDLLWKYLNLSVTERTDLARRIGTTKDQVMEDLTEIDRITAHF